MRICIFGASADDLDPRFVSETERLGEALAKRGHSLIFGGGAHGMMGAAARGFTAGGGHITGVAPRFFDLPGVIYQQCDAFVWPDSMRDRKKYMEDNADAFIICPGGVGTYEEFFEVLTLKQLGRHTKPIAVFNIAGFYDRLLGLLKENAEEGIVRAQTLELYGVTATVDETVDFVETDRTDPARIRFY